MSNNEINIKIYKQDYNKLINIKTIYEVSIIKYYGLEEYKLNLLNNRFILISVLIGLIILYGLSNIIFSVDVITNDNIMRNKLYTELKEYGIYKYKFKKSYEKLQYIKKDILSKYKDNMEWIEIESVGTKYIIRYEPRIINENKTKINYRHIIAKKDAVIKGMNISSGQIVKNINAYVKKGDIIVSGYIDLNGNIKDTIVSDGTIYGEVWYQVTINYPYKYYEEYKTGKSKSVYLFKFLNKNIEILNFNKYKTKFVNNKTILKNSLLPIKFIKQIQYETNKKEEDNTKDELINKAIKYSKKKIRDRLKDGEYINKYKVLNKIMKDKSIELNIFFSVIEDITDYEYIEEYNEIGDNNE